MELAYINTYPLYDFLAMREKPVQADAIFVLGAGSLGPVQKAAELWKDGFARHIAFVSKGGNFGGNLLFGITESEAYAEYLIRFGVPESAILFPPVERMTTNTLMEAKAALPFMRETMEVSRLILVSRPVHQRRAWATFAKQWPDVNLTSCPCDEELSIELLDRMLSELDRFEEYGERGHLLQPEIPRLIQSTAARLRLARSR